jgi:SAM-dependent methyltransferase
MATYFFQLGHCPELSHAEILSVNLRLGSPLSSFCRHETMLLAEGPAAAELVPFWDELAGTIRVCELIHHQPPAESGSPILRAEDLAQAVLACDPKTRLALPEKRPLFGFSLFCAIKSSHKRYGILHDTAALLKDQFKQEGSGSRFVLPAPDSDPSCLSAAQVDKNNLLTHGAELCIWIHSQEGVRIGITRWIQSYEEFAKRDYGRPQRDAKSGMLPPKLARMLINLGRTQETRSLLDPFCGSGSVLNEAALMGLDAVGIDLSAKAVQDSNANWRWMQANVPTCPGVLRAMKGDARQLHTLCEPLFFDTCVTEPYMGPPQKKAVPKHRFKVLCDELRELYIRALGEIRSVVKPGSRVVFIVPKFKVQDLEAPQPIPVASILKMQGYTFLDPLNEFKPSERRATLVYSRPQQIVQREIFVLQA